MAQILLQIGWYSDNKYRSVLYWNVKRLYGATIWQNTVWNTVEEQFAEILSEIIWNIVAVWENAQGHSTRLLEPCAERGTPNYLRSLAMMMEVVMKMKMMVMGMMTKVKTVV